MIATKSMAHELAPEQIRVNALCPVAGETPLLPMFHGRRHAGDSRQVHRVDSDGPAFAQPLDVANAALYLASDEAELHHRRRARGRWRTVHLTGEFAPIGFVSPGNWVRFGFVLASFFSRRR